LEVTTVPSLSRFNRRDPWWESDGPAARREHSRRWLKSSVAFVASVTAMGGAVFVWSVQLGIAAALGLRTHLPFG
jgi:hypothetical protein